MNDKIVKRIVLGMPFQLQSPLCISNGDDNHTDKDVICDMTGTPFIPGTSLAGAIRNYLSIEQKEKTLFGYSLQNGDNADGRMSSIYFSDTVLNHAKICTRDGIALKETSEVDNKFDWEVVDTGASGCFWIEIVIRESDSEEDAYNLIKEAMHGMNSGKLRLGYRKNRGFGKIKILSVREWTFTKDNMREWLAFKRPEQLENMVSVEQWIGSDTDKWRAKNNYATILVPLRLDGGISIRKYATKAGEADFEHITSNEKPVVPGTSWNGVIRSCCKEFLEQFGVKDSKKAIEQWFGHIGEIKKQSSIIIEESILENSIAVRNSRNKVNRFDASTVTGALYTEVANFTGNTKLVLHVAKKENDWKAIVGMLLFVIRDIQNGFLAVGGQTAVGRGIFAEDGEVILENCQKEECEGEIAKWVTEQISK